MWLPTPFYVAVLILDDPTLSVCVHATWMPPHYENNEDKKREVCILLRQIKKTSEKESDLPISSMGPTSFMPKVLTEEWKIFFFVVLFSVGNLACFQDY